VVSQRHTSPNQNSPRSEQMETGGEMFVGHLQTFFPWIIHDDDINNKLHF